MAPILTEKKIEYSQIVPFGLEIKGLAVENITQQESENLKHQLADHGVVVIRQQHINDDDFVSFLEQLGPLTFTTGEKPVARQPLLNVVSNVGRTTPPRSVFHTDTSYISQPPAYTALRAIKLPQSGGETVFCNQYHAFDTLPSWVSAPLQGTKVLHTVSGLTLSKDDEQQTWHPLFRRHPISGRTALYLSTPERCTALFGMAAAKSQRIIRLLYRHSIRAARCYRHHWQLGDIVVWDNRCTMHRADHSQVVGDRMLHRGLISGEAPLAPA
ncbi:MAG: TauD/TfdA family dioxygenase [Cyanobacteria bacterium J06560_2]